MAVFTKTYVQCDLCETQRELATNGMEGFFRVEVQIARLNASGTTPERVTSKTSDVCHACYNALQEGEWSNLFFGEKSHAASKSPKPLVSA